MEGKKLKLYKLRIYLKVVTLIHIFLKFGRLGKEGKVGDLIVINMGGVQVQFSNLLYRSEHESWICRANLLFRHSRCGVYFHFKLLKTEKAKASRE